MIGTKSFDRFSLLRVAVLGSAFCAALGLAPGPLHAEEAAQNPLDQWAVADGYQLSVFARGFQLPTALALVKNPSPEPKAPRMFVAELRGGIRVIANDGSISEFANVPTFKPKLEWPDFSGEGGLGAVCLEPEHGYVFVTYAYRDQTGVLRNGITRFSAKPQTFEGPAGDAKNFSAPMAAAASAFSHQIGSCIALSDALYVAVGDGGDPTRARDLQSPLGKVLRLTLDGEPHPSNAFFSQGGIPARIFAYGLRNPFGLSLVGERLFAAENGVALDRLLEIHGGRDHAWDGTDPSIAMNALAVFTPTVGPAHLVYAEPNAKALSPSDRERLVFAASNGKQGPGVISAPVNLAQNAFLTSAPTFIVHYEGSAEGEAVTGLALTDEGLYFSPILAQGAEGVVLKLKFDPAHAHKNIIGKKAGDPIMTRGCRGCHSLNGVGGQVGPPLDSNSLITRTETRVLDPGYATLVEKLDASGDAALVAGRAARHEVLDAPRDAKAHVWIINRIMNPKFDSPDASMPNLNIPREEAERIAEQIIGWGQAKSPTMEILTSRRLLAGVAVGMGFSALVALLIAGVRRLRGRKPAAPAAVGPSTAE